MDFGDARRKPNFAGKVAVAVALTVMCILVLKQSPGFGGTSVVCANSLPHQLDYVTHLLMSWHSHDSFYLA
jgi:UDP-arabinose 4-epimerase